MSEVVGNACAGTEALIISYKLSFCHFHREREVVAAELKLRYNALKTRWKSVLELSCAEDEREKLCNPAYLQAGGDEKSSGGPSSSASSSNQLQAGSEDPQLVFLKLQAQVSTCSRFSSSIFFYVQIFNNSLSSSVDWPHFRCWSDSFQY